MSLPDVVAFPVEAAMEQIQAAGLKAELQKTYPAKPFPGNGRWRIVRQTPMDGGLKLVAAEECEGIPT